MELARDILSRSYGLEGRLARMPGFVDENYRVDSAHGRFVLKVVPPDADSDYLEFQVALLDHLASALSPDASVQLPRLIRPVSGDALVSIDDGRGVYRKARLVSFLSGRLMSVAQPHGSGLLYALGQALAQVDEALSRFDHPGAHRFDQWDLKQAPAQREHLHLVQDASLRSIVEKSLNAYADLDSGLLDSLPRSVIHGDANDNNIVVSCADVWPQDVVGLIDFGDAVYTQRIHEVAIAAAYAMLDKADPMSAARAIVRGYASVLPLEADEIHVLFPAIKARLAVSTVIAAQSRRSNPDNAYLQVSADPVERLLVALDEVNVQWAEVLLRDAAGLEPEPKAPALRTTLSDAASVSKPILGYPLSLDNVFVHDLSVTGQPSLPAALTAEEWTSCLERERGAERVGVGRYNEYRLAYTTDTFVAEGVDGPERRTLHLGVDLFAPAGTPVYAPLDGVVHAVADNGMDLNYGPTLILRHELGGTRFYTLYGHLGRGVLTRLSPGDSVTAGDQMADLGDETVNGGWPPHLHFQVISRMFGHDGDFVGVAPASLAAVYGSVCPNPAALLGLPNELVEAPPPTTAHVEARRKQHLPAALSLSYSNSPGGGLHIVRGRGAMLYDVQGRAYLDCVNNVCHIGHAHPAVVDAVSRQMALLNTNTRYLHDNLARYVHELAARLPASLSKVFLVCSGSEANDLALRLARAATGKRGVVVIDHAYHGNLSSLIEISPYKHNGPGGQGPPDHVRSVAMPDVFRGRFGADVAAYVDDALRQIDEMAASTFGLSAFFAESLLSCGGQIELPPGYLAQVHAAVREQGAVVVADEVQVGFGRVGSHFWGFETQDVVPDIVTMGKPIGNGHPLAAVATTEAIADAFSNGMEYFNTFGGNPVSCAAGLAVLDTIERENLQQNAAHVGKVLVDALRDLQARYSVIGDVRGRGLFLGMEFVEDADSKKPAARQASYVVNRMKERGVLLSTDGPDHNVIKIKPPIVFGRAHVDQLVGNLEKVLAEDAAQPSGAL